MRNVAINTQRGGNLRMSATKKTAKGTTATKKRYEGFTDEERSAMTNRVQEMKLGKGDLESEVLAKIAEMPAADREMARRIHAIVKASAPTLSPKLWYGMPAYAREGKIVCFFQTSTKFKTRYSTFGFNDPAHLDEGNMWPVAYALTKLTSADEARIRALVEKAAG
jgi:uncharacterized protein YdhG (YjbR/CyaY superfamily)